MHVFIYPSVHTYIYKSTYPRRCLLIFTRTRTHTHTHTHPHMISYYLPIHLSIYLSIRPLVSLPVSLTMYPVIASEIDNAAQLT